MYKKIDFVTKFRVVALYNAHWKSQVIVTYAHCIEKTIQRWERRMQIYDVSNLSHTFRASKSRRLSTLVKNSMLKYHKTHSWLYQDELITYLKKKWDIIVSQLIVYRVLK